MINAFNRIVVVVLWLLLLAGIGYTTIFPDSTITALLGSLSLARNFLRVQQQANSMNFLIGQVAVGIVVVFIFGTLLWLELWPHRQRGVRMKTVKGSSVELDTDSIAPPSDLAPGSTCRCNYSVSRREIPRQCS